MRDSNSSSSSNFTVKCACSELSDCIFQSLMLITEVERCLVQITSLF